MHIAMRFSFKMQSLAQIFAQSDSFSGDFEAAVQNFI